MNIHFEKLKMSLTRNERRARQRQGAKVLKSLQGKDLKEIYKGKYRELVVVRAPWYKRLLGRIRAMFGQGPKIQKVQ